ncbi:sodium/potassium/calcium exchanger 3-like [Anopheles cruzii]|uniref:sodium/potassium/calcium exchanger 3-like n=1 Tax=Anopheles cruzii TaxID=68878 RepID=UPI0022EC58EB|nr:sodium/potassium/calcium exchanger 3-like [Anopheles cruzii]
MARAALRLSAVSVLVLLMPVAMCMVLIDSRDYDVDRLSAARLDDSTTVSLYSSTTPLQNNSTTLVSAVPLHLTLNERIELEKLTWHWYPWRRINYEVLPDGRTEEVECEENSAMDDLPDDIFTQEQRLQGAIVLHFVGAIYFFTLVAYVCGEYFLPSVECICEDLNLTQDVAAATFMAIASTMPEFFTNTISTFIADSDMGLGTVMGSLLFNTLGVAGLAGLATKMPVQLDWWPLTRDAFIFMAHIGLLIGFAWDGRIYWYEAMVLFILFFFYFVLMFQNKRLMRVAKKYIEVRWNLCARVIRNIEEDERIAAEAQQQQELPTVSNLPRKTLDKPAFRPSTASILSEQMAETKMRMGELQIPARHVVEDTGEYESMTLWKISTETWYRTAWWWYSWPLRLVTHFTIPNPVVARRWYPLTFIMCVVYLAACAFMTFWLLTIIGYTFDIPDSVMGLTFLAFGGCMPEAVSAILVIRTGSGAMGVSNAMGANTLAILFSLGLPWFIRTLADGGSGENAYMVIASYGLQYSIIALLGSVIFLYLVIYIAMYKLRKTVGLILFVGYALFVAFMVLNELDVIIPSGDEC